MCFIYFEDKVINFTSEPTLRCDRVLTLAEGERIGIAKMLENLENSKYLCVKAADPQRACGEFRSQFVAVEAAGGLVEDGEGRLLMIFRRGKWDLPKGHVDPGETPLQAAVREVCEETGVRVDDAPELVTSTYHFYNMHGRWEMKRTWWYAMKAATQAVVPQTEEDITRAEWVERERVAECARKTYSSIVEVLRVGGFIGA